MAAGFRRTGAGIELRLRGAEVLALRQLVGELLTLLEEGASAVPSDPLAAFVGIAESAVRPADPALARLLPDAYADDEEAAGDFRRFTEADLRAGKRSSARRVLHSLDEAGSRLTLDDAAAQSWLGTLNDLRLALGVRLEVTGDTSAELDRLGSHHPHARMLSVYGWLGYLQETLVEAVAGP